MNVERNKENIENINNNIAILVPLLPKKGGEWCANQHNTMINKAIAY